ncbi:MAG: ABC transporter permease [Lachnospiraceae bacterium]|nr:ABC transporter permease [Lachnospiraceae bacterium]
MLFVSTLRQIRKTFGRFIAIFAIICLGVGFFVGLKVTKDAMVITGGQYLDELNMFDFRLVTTLGLTAEDVSDIAAIPCVGAAEGSNSADFLFMDEGGSESVLHAHSYLNAINSADLVAGRLPEAADECVLDSLKFSNDMIGNTIVLSKDNSQETLDTFAFDEYKVVGTVHSPAYINFERGGSSLGEGKVQGFAYLSKEGFSTDYYSEIYLRLKERYEVYSEDYDDYASKCEEEISKVLEKCADRRYKGLKDDVLEEIHSAEKELADGRAEFDEQIKEAEKALSEAETGLETLAALMGKDSPMYIEKYAEYETGVAELDSKKEEYEAKFADAQAEIDDAYIKLDEELKEPQSFTLGRTTNFGYMSLQNDTDIVSGIAKVFPLFFFLVAALVCITTMTRMVAEQRVQNGVLKALGYSNGQIIGQYLFYSGTASILGCFAGMMLGSKLMPMVLWEIYHIMYTIDRPIVFVLDWGLFALCALAYLICAFGATWFACAGDLREASAQLIRPKSPDAGKRIFLERIGFIWNRIKFLHKVSIRNILRYKKRMFMMIIGVGGCTALLVTGFGIRDSIQPIVSYQFDEIHVYDMSVSFMKTVSEDDIKTIEAECADVTGEIVYCQTQNMNLLTNASSDSLSLIIADDIPKSFVRLANGDEEYSWPGRDEVIIDYRLAMANDLKIGDMIELGDDEYNTLKLKVSGIFDNYLYDYAYISSETYEAQLGKAVEYNTAYVNSGKDTDVHYTSAKYLDLENVSNVSVTGDMRDRVGNMLSSLDYVVLIVLVCAGALAFIVIYNLTNISINERIRELATIKVLGFYRRESASYVFRENIVLTIISALFGLPLGIALHRYVMAQIKINSMYFGHRILPMTFVWSFLVTIAFAMIVDFFMFFKLDKVNMAESLKAVD